VMEITNEVASAARMLKAGNVFMKFSQSGAPHDRWVWLSEDGGRLHWADPEKKKKGKLKGAEAELPLSEIAGFSEGLRSELGHHQKSSLLQSMRAFKGHTSGIHKLDVECCLTVLGKGRSLDLQAQSKMVRRDWLMAIRMLVELRTDGVHTSKGRAKIRSFMEVHHSSSGHGGFTNFFAKRSFRPSPGGAAGSSGRLTSGSLGGGSGGPANGDEGDTGSGHYRGARIGSTKDILAAIPSGGH
jgi:hypothetical protein